jgi:hypothetical protein
MFKKNICWYTTFISYYNLHKQCASSCYIYSYLHKFCAKINREHLNNARSCKNIQKWYLKLAWVFYKNLLLEDPGFESRQGVRFFGKKLMIF